MQCQSGAREFGFQAREQIAVELHGIKMRHACEQFTRERSRTGADFDHAIVGSQGQRRDDTADDIPVVQEMLAEALAWSIRAHKSSIHMSISFLSVQ